MPTNFFEKFTNINSDTELRRKLTVSGDLVSYFKNSKNTLEQLARAGGGNSLIVHEMAKK